MTNEENSNLKEEKIVLTPNGMKVLEYFQSLEGGNIQIVGKDLADILDIKGIYPVLNSLKMKGLINEVTSTARLFVNNKGASQVKEYKTYSLTQKGKDFPISPKN